MIKRMIPVALLAAIALGGCASKHYLDTQYTPYRADLTDQPIEVSHTPPAAAPVEVVNPDPSGGASATPPVEDVVTGTWTFTTPRTVTRVERKSGDLAEFSLYNGRPSGTQTPMVVITVAPPGSDTESQATSDGEKYKVSGSRDYVLNGNLAKEWTGLTSNGSAFCELIVRRAGGKGDVCHAMAVAKDTEERKAALDILGSITWQARP